ncbi:hypothetical protein [Brumimicrobium mesophilum]|uniref:hypothetical protein n=1 Tax=Brumimicrobium mesophilum TaxID=392717 RepID=UPI00131E3183|nr:hypothetical protein [Brumimicrobium mesophilum]
MKKSMIILGAFTLLIAAPSFAQEKTAETTKELKTAEPKLEMNKAKTSEEQVMESEKEGKAKVIPNSTLKTTEPFKKREVKSSIKAKEEDL